MPPWGFGSEENWTMWGKYSPIFVMGGKVQKTAISGLIRCEDGIQRCHWVGAHSDYIRYHDQEWGRPVYDNRRLFEKICLEGFQSGLSWLCILRKRENFREAFCNFDVQKIAKFGETEVSKLLQNSGIVRHRGKILSTINNARRAIELQSEMSLSDYLWSFQPKPQDRPKTHTWRVLKTITKTPNSLALSRDLKKRGWTFVGPTTAYALMQAMGMVNDHVEGCCMRGLVGSIV